jgi:hypothetical protein
MFAVYLASPIYESITQTSRHGSERYADIVEVPSPIIVGVDIRWGK